MGNIDWLRVSGQAKITGIAWTEKEEEISEDRPHPDTLVRIPAILIRLWKLQRIHQIVP
jgi:hypothetical protein